VWAYFIFATVFELAGGTDAWGHTYIYRCLDWSFPWTGGGSYSAGKALYIIFFSFVPVLNYLFWLLLWTRRRALVSRKGDKGRSGGSATITLLANRVAPAPRMFFEYAADYRDLALDGRHWRAQFGGSSGRGPKMGAYVLCSPVLYTLFRLLLCMGSGALFVNRVIEFDMQWKWQGGEGEGKHFVYFLLYYQNWVLFIAALYFLLAFGLTAAATFMKGAESSRPPVLVWIVWALYGMLLPSAVIQGVLYVTGFVVHRDLVELTFENTLLDSSSHMTGVFNHATVVDLVTFIFLGAITFTDAWINRQPYYATFHAFLGIAFNWGYALFLIIYCILGGTDAGGGKIIYEQFYVPEFTLVHIMQYDQVIIMCAWFVLPVYCAMYWCALWARRRALIASKQPAV